MKPKEKKMSSKVYIVQLDTKNIRTIRSSEIIHIGSVIEDEIWFGTLIKGGKVIKVFR